MQSLCHARPLVKEESQQYVLLCEVVEGEVDALRSSLRLDEFGSDSWVFFWV